MSWEKGVEYCNLVGVMASAVTFPPCFGINSEFKPRFRVRAERLGGNDLPVLSSDGVSVNETGSVIGEKEKKWSFLDGGNERLKSRVEKKLEKEMVSEELQVLWDDGYGTNTVKDYLNAAKDMIKPDGGPPRWFCPVECGRPVKDSPVLLFLPGKLISSALILFLCFSIFDMSSLIDG